MMISVLLLKVHTEAKSRSDSLSWLFLLRSDPYGAQIRRLAIDIPKDAPVASDVVVRLVRLDFHEACRLSSDPRNELLEAPTA